MHFEASNLQWPNHNNATANLHKFVNIFTSESGVRCLSLLVVYVTVFLDIFSWGVLAPILPFVKASPGMFEFEVLVGVSAHPVRCSDTHAQAHAGMHTKGIWRQNSTPVRSKSASSILCMHFVRWIFWYTEPLAPAVVCLCVCGVARPWHITRCPRTDIHHILPMPCRCSARLCWDLCRIG